MENYHQSSTPPTDHMAPISGNLLEVTVIGCNKLKDTEWISRQDPYVCLEYGSSKFRTRTCRDGGKNPTFQEKFVITLIEGLRELNTVVWNSNTISCDDFIGSEKIDLQKVLSQGYDDRLFSLQTKTGRYAGDVRLILHYAGAYWDNKTPRVYASSVPPNVHYYPAFLKDWSEALKAESQEWKMYHLVNAIPEVIKVTVEGRVNPDVGGGGTSNEEVKKQQMEAALKKIIGDAVKSHINTIVLLPTNEVDTRVDIEPDNNADPTSGKAQLQLMKKIIGEATLEKVNEIVLAISGQAAFSLMAYASINSSLTSEPNSPALIVVVGTNALAFIASLASLSFREKMPRATSFLAKVGGIAVAASVVGALAMYLPVNIQWASSLAFALPALAILYA